MNKKHGILFGFAVLLTAAIFTFAGCGGDDDDDEPASTLTITGIPETYNNKYAAVYGEIEEGEASTIVVAIANNEGKAKQIKGGSVTLSVFSVEVDGEDIDLTPYTGNAEEVEINLGIFEAEDLEFGPDVFDSAIASAEFTVSFTNGSDTVRNPTITTSNED
ncbi:MAG: hypothetical protein LBP19_03475 [Treponema sp.]|jgi:hypothetical protein|nr:hypothetical protein [Treponema sp.]